MHLIGFSLGAHVVGFTGKKFQGISRITGLDPAGPLYLEVDESRRLTTTDAKFVDILHSDVLRCGFNRSLGHVDFYVNGGVDNGGQGPDHYSAHDFYNSTIWNKPAVGYQCPNSTNFWVCFFTKESIITIINQLMKAHWIVTICRKL